MKVRKDDACLRMELLSQVGFSGAAPVKVRKADHAWGLINQMTGFSGAAPVKVRKERAHRLLLLVDDDCFSGAAPVKVRKARYTRPPHILSNCASVGPHP